MKKIMVVQRSDTSGYEYMVNRENAAKFLTTHLAGDFILLEPWIKDFNSKSVREQLHILSGVIEEADVVFLVSGWVQDPMCRVLYEVAGMLKKTIVDGKE